MIAWLILGAVSTGLLVSYGAAWLVRRAAPRVGLIDEPGAARKVHTRATPLGGGIAIWLGVVLPLGALESAAWLSTRADTTSGGIAAVMAHMVPEAVRPHLPGLVEQAPDLGFLLGAATVLMLLGLADDSWGLSWIVRLAIEVLVAVAVVAYGWRLTLFVDAPWLTSAATVVWIVALVNSFNMLDNMDGLSGGVAAIASAMLATVLLMAPDPRTAQPQLFIAGLLLVLTGSLLGFLGHNRPPARLFMGDAGSYFIGFLIAVATILATFSGGNLPRHAILAPLCVLAVPLYDLVTVVAIRLRAGRSPFEADKNHFSHRLVELGMTKTQAVLTIYLMTATCGLGALLLHQVSTTGAVVVALLVACVLALVGILETAGRRNNRRP